MCSEEREYVKTVPLRDGRKIDFEERSWEDGDIAAERPYRGGKNEGIVKHYDINGSLISVFFFCKDKADFEKNYSLK